MNVKVIELIGKQAKLAVQTKSGVKELVINETTHGHSYNDFTDWEITDRQYYDLEDLVDDVIKRMEGSNSLNVEW